MLLIFLSAFFAMGRNDRRSWRPANGVLASNENTEIKELSSCKCETVQPVSGMFSLNVLLLRRQWLAQKLSLSSNPDQEGELELSFSSLSLILAPALPPALFHQR